MELHLSSSEILNHHNISEDFREKWHSYSNIWLTKIGNECIEYYQAKIRIESEDAYDMYIKSLQFKEKFKDKIKNKRNLKWKKIVKYCDNIVDIFRICNILKCHFAINSNNDNNDNVNKLHKIYIKIFKHYISNINLKYTKLFYDVYIKDYIKNNNIKINKVLGKLCYFDNPVNENKNCQLIEWIIENVNMSDVNTCNINTCNINEKVFNDVCSKGYLKLAKLLKNHFNYDKNTNLLFMCCINNKLTIVKWLHNEFNYTTEEIIPVMIDVGFDTKHKSLEPLIWLYNTFNLTIDDIEIIKSNWNINSVHNRRVLQWINNLK